MGNLLNTRARATAALLRAAGQITQTSADAMVTLKVETAFENVSVRRAAMHRVKDVFDQFDCDRSTRAGAARIFRGAALADFFPAPVAQS